VTTLDRAKKPLGETWYLVRFWDSADMHEIREVVVERSTTGSVWIEGRRNSRTSDYQRYFPTRHEAVNFLREQLTKRYKNHLDNAARFADALKNLK